MGYQDSLEYLYGLQLTGIKLGLENVRTLLQRLGNPEQKVPTVHIAGTNGKGSTAAALARILQEAGYRTGLYTSPHLVSFTERIQINGGCITSEEVAVLTDEIRSVVDELPITFFEFTTAMALLDFARKGVDIAVVETGLGGRLDATNVVTPIQTLVTPVSLDHSDYLGETLAEIAAEKAGIFKPKVPVLLGPQKKTAQQVLEEKAAALNCPLFQWQRDFHAKGLSSGEFRYQGLRWQLDPILPRLQGEHQQANLSLALVAAEQLKDQGWSISAEAAQRGVETAFWPGRLEWWSPQILLDGAHNRDGAEALASYLEAWQKEGTRGEVRWVVGLKADRAPADILDPLLPYCTKMYACTASDGEGASVDVLMSYCHAQNKDAASYASSTMALQAALQDLRPTDIVLVAGSLYMVGEIRAFLVMQRESNA